MGSAPQGEQNQYTEQADGAPTIHGRPTLMAKEALKGSEADAPCGNVCFGLHGIPHTTQAQPHNAAK